MTDRGLILCVALTAAALCGCDPWRASSSSNKIVTHSGGVSSGARLALVGPNSLVRGSGDEPAIVWIEARDADRTMGVAWIVIARHGPWERGGWERSQAGSDDRKVWFDGRLALDEEVLEIGYVRREEKSGEGLTLVDELELAGASRDLAAGRVFLVDLRSDPATVEQLDLPVATPPPTVVGEEAAERLLEELGRDARVAAFLRG